MEEREGIDAMGGGLEFLWRGVKHDDAETGDSKRKYASLLRGGVQTRPNFFFLLSFLFFSLSFSPHGGQRARYNVKFSA